MGSILLIDDEEKLRSLLARIIRSEGFEVTEANDLRAAAKRLEERSFQVALCDVKLPDGNGIDFTRKLKKDHPDTEVILMTAYGNIPDGVQAMKNGAFDYLVKGDDNDRIIPLLYRALEKNRMQSRIRELETRVNEKFSFDAVIGQSKPVLQAIDLARKVAPMDTPVLLTGETGTGKEVFAQTIHQAGRRSLKSFVAINCSTFSKEMLESELFGHRQGAFTGAVKDKKGLVEEANGGTLFLDEIGEMHPELQAKLLRVLETGEFIKLGDTKPSRSDFRLIAATNRDLKKESDEHRFRRDLYFRLNVFEIHLPPLRERGKDIETLALHYIKKYADKVNTRPKGEGAYCTPDFLEKLETYAWPGNIRELKNVMERAVILSDGQPLTPDFLPFDIRESVSDGNSEPASWAMWTVEKTHISKVLQHTRGNKTEAARLLGIGVATLYRKIEEYGL